MFEGMMALWKLQMYIGLVFTQCTISKMPKKIGFDNFQMANTIYKLTSNANWGIESHVGKTMSHPKNYTAQVI